MDGKRIAYAVTGEGPPIVRCMGWFTHLETEWISPIGRGFWQRLSKSHQLVRYDGRGMGLSEATSAFTSESRLADLEAVIDAAGLDRFALIAVSEGARTAIRYSIKHPDRVTHLVLYGCAIYPNSPKSEQVKENFFANQAMIKTGWGKETHRRFFADLFLGLNASPEERDYFAEIQRRSCTPEVALAYYNSLGELDQAFEVAHQVSVPTLILHPEEDRMVEFSCSVQLAAEIPGARFKPLSGDCHYLMLNTERSQAEEYISAIESFMAVSDSSVVTS